MHPVDSSLPLYDCDGKIITTGDVLAALRRVGVVSGDSLFVHSDVATFGRPLILDRSKFLGTLIDILRESVGGTGTIIMPTFTYSFCDGKIYDVAESRSTVGVLTEYFRTLPGVVRTRHPIFSVAIQGPGADEFVEVGMDSFDNDSIFGKLHTRGGKILVFGAPFATSLTFLHYIEETHGVPYRYMKEFRGVIRDGGKDEEGTCTYYVRNLAVESILNADRLEPLFISAGIFKRESLGAAHILVAQANRLFDEGIRMLDQDPYAFIAKR